MHGWSADTAQAAAAGAPATRPPPSWKLWDSNTPPVADRPRLPKQQRRTSRRWRVCGAGRRGSRGLAGCHRDVQHGGKLEHRAPPNKTPNPKTLTSKRSAIWSAKTSQPPSLKRLEGKFRIRDVGATARDLVLWLVGRHMGESSGQTNGFELQTAVDCNRGQAMQHSRPQGRTPRRQCHEHTYRSIAMWSAPARSAAQRSNARPSATDTLKPQIRHKPQSAPKQHGHEVVHSSRRVPGRYGAEKWARIGPE